MKTPDCEDCVNKSVFEEYAEFVTANEEAARIGFDSGCTIGSIACRGMIKNPFLGNICAARLERPIVPGVYDINVTKMISPASIVGEIPGYSLYAKTR
jgi:hypothetical protein